MEHIEIEELKEVMGIFKVMGWVYVGISAIKVIGLITIASALTRFLMFLQMTYYCR